MRLATRGSPLARWQARRVARRLEEAGVRTELVIVTTGGDRDRATPLWRLGGAGVFVREVQAAVLDGRADVAVHSAKDLPTTPVAGLVLGALCEREDPTDALVGASLDALPTGATVATGSVRRRALLAAERDDLRFVELRGNIGTRLARLGEVDALVMATAALIRLGMADRIAERLDPRVVVPQVGQGALALECRASDHRTRGLLEALDEPDVRAAVTAERAFLARLGGGCDLPLAAHAVHEGGTVTVTGVLAAPDGTVVLRHRDRGPDPGAVGVAVAEHLLASGGSWLMGEGFPP